MSVDRSGFADEYPFESHFIDVNGHRMHYIDEGQGPVLLCVHGNPTWSFAWRNIARDFSKDFRVIAVDHIGCGMSDKPQDAAYTLQFHIDNLRELITKLDLTDITLIAHDWGGAIGVGVTGMEPDRFRRTILMNTAAFRSKAIPFRIALCRIPLLGTWGIRGFNLFAGTAVYMAVEKPLPKAAKQGYLAPYNSWHNRIATDLFVKDIPLSPNHKSYQTLVNVEESLAERSKHPMLLIWGMRDWCFTPAFYEEFQRRCPNAKAVPIDDAGHYIFEDARERLSAEIRAFLNENPIHE
ncbi:alpha/beta fold hydrolase [Calycomorphotria hydatis]|uniref:Haloalkane dehalogenase n=1 Tax=Calycomorphotria hydatis TaxID=2528027 RepID=A0A517T9B4_9PLAN|nr:alpha/beta fold hydrolase [Calycomorphotria hydatis]QDT64972.1 Haloalkane dehalogenase [Calycomorphotria hydatis]